MFASIKTPRGFTLVEIMVVVTIIGIFSSLTIINFRGNEKQRDLKNAALLVVDGLKRGQTMALSGQDVDGNGPAAAYYFYLSGTCTLPPCSYQLKAYNNPTSSTDLDTISLGQNFILKAIDSSNTDLGKVAVKFKPPRANAIVLVGDCPLDESDLNCLKNNVIFKISHISDPSSIFTCVYFSAISGRVDIKPCPAT